MAKRLTRTVIIAGVAYTPASVIPAEIAERITNPKAWEDAPATPAVGVAPTVDSGKAPGPVEDLPVPDAEATVKELREYAKAKGVVLGAAKTKPEILAVLGLDGADDETELETAPEGDETGAEPAEADEA